MSSASVGTAASLPHPGPPYPGIQGFVFGPPDYTLIFTLALFGLTVIAPLTYSLVKYFLRQKGVPHLLS